jgi:hypothetical protein
VSCIFSVLAPDSPRQIGRVRPLAAIFGSRQRNQPLQLSHAERHAFARGGGKNQSVDRSLRVMPHQPPQRRLVEFAVAKRRHQRQPQALQ